MEDRNTKMHAEMGDMLCIKLVQALKKKGKKAEGYEGVQKGFSFFLIIIIYPVPFQQIVLLSGKWVKRQKKKKEMKH